jgi:hypothetical protein
MRVVLVDPLPMPPHPPWGLVRFADFERNNFDGYRVHRNHFLKSPQ